MCGRGFLFSPQVSPKVPLSTLATSRLVWHFLNISSTETQLQRNLQTVMKRPLFSHRLDMSSPSNISECQTSQILGCPRAGASFWAKANHVLNAEIKTSRKHQYWLHILVIIRGVEVLVTTRVLFIESNILL